MQRPKWNRRAVVLGGMGAFAATALRAAAAPSFQFEAIDGGKLDTAQWRGKPVLVVNTASLCGYAGQYDALQDLHERFGEAALILAVPSDDFNQELATEAEVKEYCAMTFDLTPPLTRITHAVGETAHPLGRAKRPAASPAGTSTRC